MKGVGIWRPWNEEKARRVGGRRRAEVIHKRQFSLSSVQDWPGLRYFFMSLSWKMPSLSSFLPKQIGTVCCFARTILEDGKARVPSRSRLIGPGSSININVNRPQHTTPETVYNHTGNKLQDSSCQCC